MATIELNLVYDTAVVAAYRFENLEDANVAIAGFKRLLDTSNAKLVVVSMSFETSVPFDTRETTALTQDVETAALLRKKWSDQ